jgi:hypothetical protein
MPEWQVVPGQRITALHHSAHHMAAFGAGHDLILHQEADAVDETSTTAVGRVHLGQSYQIPPAFGGAAAKAGWERAFRASEVEVFQVRHSGHTAQM